MTAKARRDTWSRSPEMKAERQTERIDRARPLVATRREKVRAIDRKGNKNGARQAAGPRNSRFTSTADIFAAFLDLGGLAMKLAQVVELGTANHAPGDHGYPLYRRRMEREAAFDSHAEGDFADQEALANAGAGTGQYHALESLGSSPIAFDNSDVHPNGIARTEVGDVLAELAFVYEIESLHIDFSFSPCAQVTSVVGAVCRLSVGNSPVRDPLRQVQRIVIARQLDNYATRIGRAKTRSTLFCSPTRNSLVPTNSKPRPLYACLARVFFSFVPNHTYGSGQSFAHSSSRARVASHRMLPAPRPRKLRSR